MHPKGANANAMSVLSFRNTLVGTGWAICLVFCTNELKKLSSHLVARAPISGSENFFHNLDKWLLAESHDCCKLLMGSCGLSHKL